MNDETEPRSGPIEGTSRILRELLRTPRFKSSVRIVLNDLDPENAALLVRVLAWEDPEFFLGLVAATPSLVNACIIAMNELLKQFEKMPAPLLAQFATTALSELDAEALGEAVGGAVAVSTRVAAAGAEDIGSAASGFARGFAKGLEEAAGCGSAELAAKAAAGIRRFAADNPALVRDTILPVVAALRAAVTEAEGTGTEVE